MNKRAAFPLVLIGAILLIGFIFAAGYANLATITGDGGYIERPVFKWVKCEPLAGEKSSSKISLPSAGMWSPSPSVSQNYRVRVYVDDAPLINAGLRIKYSVCNSKILNAANCPSGFDRIQTITKGATYDINAKSNEFVFVRYEYRFSALSTWQGRDGSSISTFWIPYGLRVYDVLHSGGSLLVADSCSVGLTDESWKDRFVGSDSQKVNSAVKPGGEMERELGPNELRNYVTGYVTSPSADKAFITYNGQNAWCLRNGGSGTIFKVNSLTAGSVTYKVASVEYSDQLGTEACCPGDKKPGYACNDNFKWMSTQPLDSSGTTEVQCSAFNPCQGGSYTPYDLQTLAKYSCVQGKCVLQTKKVQCSTNKDCIDTNQICDTNLWKCVNANVNLNGEVTKTQADNAIDCSKAGGTWVTDRTTDYTGTFCFKAFGNHFGSCEAVTTSESYCKMPKFNWSLLAWILVITAILIFVIKFRGPIFGSLRGVFRI